MNYRLLAGLGNPGSQYANTRHNLGFMVLDEVARLLGWEWKEEKRFLGKIAKGKVKGETVVLLQPLTFMNESGRSIRQVLNFFKWTPENVLIVVDDVAIPFREMRLKEKGNPGGHNGLKSVEQHLGTRDYARLRMGVGDQERGSLHKHVLGRFTKGEEEKLDAFLTEGMKIVERLLKQEAFERVANDANRRIKKETSQHNPSEAG